MKIRKWIPAIIWMAVIFYLSSQPTTSIRGTAMERFYILKTFHLIEYAILAICLYLPIQKYITTFFISYLYSISDEYHQTFVSGRTGRLFDTLYDSVGIAVGLFIIYTLLKIIRSRYRKN